MNIKLGIVLKIRRNWIYAKVLIFLSDVIAICYKFQKSYIEKLHTQLMNTLNITKFNIRLGKTSSKLYKIDMKMRKILHFTTCNLISDVYDALTCYVPVTF